MSDFLDEKKAEIQARLEELRPAVEEHGRLEAALAAIDGAGRAPANGTGAGGRRGRPRGTGTRAQEAIDAITKEPGLTAGEIAERMGINQNYLYRVLPSLEQDGKLEKRGRGWYLPGA